MGNAKNALGALLLSFIGLVFYTFTHNFWLRFFAFTTTDVTLWDGFTTVKTILQFSYWAMTIMWIIILPLYLTFVSDNDISLAAIFAAFAAMGFGWVMTYISFPIITVLDNVIAGLVAGGGSMSVTEYTTISSIIWVAYTLIVVFVTIALPILISTQSGEPETVRPG